jgi:hypothetical protein
MSNPKLLIFAGIICLSICGFALANGTPDPNLYPDLNGDEVIDFEDFAIMANNWKQTGVGLAGDFDNNHIVDSNDLYVIAYRWLEGPRPKTVFEQFKAALEVNDVNKALTFISEVQREKYTDIFRIIQPILPVYTDGMGDLILYQEQNRIVKYEMRHQVSSETYLFPVIFIKEKDGSWKIYSF